MRYLKLEKSGIFKQGNQQGGWTRMEGLGGFIAAGPSGVLESVSKEKSYFTRKVLTKLLM